MSRPIHHRCLALVYTWPDGARLCGATLRRVRRRRRLNVAVRQAAEMGWGAERIAAMVAHEMERRCWRHGGAWGRRPR